MIRLIVILFKLTNEALQKVSLYQRLKSVLNNQLFIVIVRFSNLGQKMCNTFLFSYKLETLHINTFMSSYFTLYVLIVDL